MVDKPVLKTCVVCGTASHRTDWINKVGNFVACDNHSSAEVQAAIAKLVPAPAKSVVPPIAPPKPVA